MKTPPNSQETVQMQRREQGQIHRNFLLPKARQRGSYWTSTNSRVLGKVREGQRETQLHREDSEQERRQSGDTGSGYEGDGGREAARRSPERRERGRVTSRPRKACTLLVRSRQSRQLVRTVPLWHLQRFTQVKQLI